MAGARKEYILKKNARAPFNANRKNLRGTGSLWAFYMDSRNVFSGKDSVVFPFGDDFSENDVVSQKTNFTDYDGGESGGKPNKKRDVPKRATFWRKRSMRQIALKVALSRKSIGASVSLFVHAIIVLILLSIMISAKVGTLGNSTELSFSSAQEKDLLFIESAGTTFEDNVNLIESSDFQESNIEQALKDEDFRQIVRNVIDNSNQNNGLVNIADVEDIAIRPDDLDGGIPFYSKKFSAGNRKQRGRDNGASSKWGDVTKESEDAVELGLEWLARHQLPDGGWSFDLTEKDSNGRVGICGGQCSNSTGTSGGNTYKQGLHPSRMAATAIALLPFLGAGYTHTEPNIYQKTVASGLRYLAYNATIPGENQTDFRAGFVQDGAAYVQALVVLTLCEAYEMTKDSSLKSLAQGGLELIENSQLNDGGWRYLFQGDTLFHANVSGDTSVLGWQMLALHSGVSAGFSVRPSVAYRAGNFLDNVMSKDFRCYRYQPESNEKQSEMWGTTAVGVLIREYLGWEPGYSQLDAGIEQIADWIDDSNSIWQKVKKGARSEKTRNGTLSFFRDDRLVYNLYFSYYAALALHNYGGDVWEKHFAKQRDFLIETQSRGGAFGNSCEKGSWLFYDKYMNDGGRLLNTSLAILILETPYRYLPMYQ